MYEFAILTPMQAPWFARFVSPEFRPLLDAVDDGGSQLAIGASYFGRPIGVALARRSCHLADLLALYVEPAYRRLGIATQLLERLEQLLNQRGCLHLSLLYDPEDCLAPALERLFAKRGWSRPTLSRLMVWFSEQSIQGCAWLRDTQFPSGFEVFPWGEVADEELEAIRQRQDTEPWYPPSLSPFSIPPAELVPFASLGLRYDGAIVGWSHCRMAASDTLLYETLFLSPEVRGQRVGLALAAEVVRRSLGRGIPYAGWGTSPDNGLMVSFFERCLMPYALRCNEEWSASKSFHPTLELS